MLIAITTDSLIMRSSCRPLLLIARVAYEGYVDRDHNGLIDYAEFVVQAVTADR